MAEEKVKPLPSEQGMSYGYSSDEVKVSPFVFGLNAGVAFLTKFLWIPNGGKDGAEMEAIDVIFTIAGTEKSYRLFPVQKAFKKGTNEEVTDRNAPEFKEALQDFNSKVTHILHTFIESDAIKVGLGKPFDSFKDFAQAAASLLPKDYQTIPLDIFMQYQWQIDTGQSRTFLEIPKKMAYGRWLNKAVPGTWLEKRAENPQESTKEALWYENEKGDKHPFIKNGWFMRSNFASQLSLNTKPAGNNAAAGAAMNAGNTVANNGAATTEKSGASQW